MRERDHVIFITRTNARRLTGILQDVIRLNLTYKSAARIIGTTRAMLHNYKRRNNKPTLHIYLAMAELFNWDIRHDVNYIYARRLLTREDINRRIARISVILKPGTPLFGTVKTRRLIYNALAYGSYGTLKHYGIGLTTIANIERQYSLPDALDLEE